MKKITKNNLRIISKQYAYLQSMATTPVKFQEKRYKTGGGVAYKEPTICSLYQELKRDTTLKEWAPSPLNFPERKNTGPLKFHIQTTYQVSRS